MVARFSGPSATGWIWITPTGVERISKLPGALCVGKRRGHYPGLGRSAKLRAGRSGDEMLQFRVGDLGQPREAVAIFDSEILICK